MELARPAGRRRPDSHDHRCEGAAAQRRTRHHHLVVYDSACSTQAQPCLSNPGV